MNVLTIVDALGLVSLPNGWSAVPLKTLIYRRTEKNRSDARLLSVYREHGVVPKASRDDNYNKAGKDLSAYLYIRPGDLVVNKMKAWQGSLAISQYAGIVSPAYFTFSVKNTVVGRYLHYLLRSSVYSRWYARISKGVRPNQWDLDIEMFARTPTLLPPLPTQRAIADFLDRKTTAIDELIRKKERLIELLQEKRQALITQAVTKGLDPNVAMKDSGIEWLGEIPAHWKLKPLKRISPRQHGRLIVSPNKYIEDDGIPIVFGFNIRNGAIDLEAIRHIGYRYEERFRKCTVAAGDLLCVRVGAPGETAVVPPELDGCHFASTMQIVQHKSFHSPWLAHVFNSHIVRHQIKSVQYGAAQEQINVGDAVKFQIPTPPLGEQIALAEHLDAKLSELGQVSALVSRQITQLHEYRRALVSAAVTGQLDTLSEPIP